jgi:tetratricopeptide (TPR) repeat protein
LAIALFLIGAPWALLVAQADYTWKRSGDALYTQEAYPDAETAYRKALEARPSAESAFNLGNSIYRQQRLDEAIAAYEDAIGRTTDPDLKADGYFNLGNALFEKQDYARSLGAYKEALKLRPDDEAARQNLMMALRQLKQQQQKQQQQNSDQPPPPKDPQDPADPSTQQQPPPQDQQDQPTQQDQPASGQDDQGQPADAKPLSEAEARDILRAIEREDQRVQEKLKKKASATKPPPVKDW